MRILTVLFTTSLLALFCVILSIFAALLVSYGMGSNALHSLSDLCGVIAMGIGLAQYIPQMVTTIKLKDNGSLSIMMLLIQFPGGMANALFMWIGRHETWSSWTSTKSAAIQQMILFGICLFFKMRKWWMNRQFVSLLSVESYSSQFMD
jgi:uncharacterized protein with PQ loop repeat